MVERNAGVAPGQAASNFEIGIHLGDVVEEADGDLMGDGVNIAARLEGICEPGGICLLGRRLPSRSRSRLGELQVAEPRATEPQEHRRAGARLICCAKPRLRRKNRPKQQPQSHARRLGALACAGRRARACASRGGGPRLAHRLHAAFPWPLPLTTSSPTRRGSRSSFCRSRTWAATPASSISADGITDDLTTDLSHVPESFVIARDTAFTFKGRQVDAKAIGRELGVRYMLEGSVR